MVHRFTFKEIGFGFFGSSKQDNPKKAYWDHPNYWLNQTKTKGRLTDKEIIHLVLSDRMNSFDPDSPIYQRLYRVRKNLENKN